jgi:hypothetical protein
LFLLGIQMQSWSRGRRSQRLDDRRRSVRR